MGKTLRFVSFVLILFICSSYKKAVFIKQNRTYQFIINGTVSGFKDSTWIYLSDGATENVIKTDSCLIIKGKFQFKGQSTVKTLNVRLNTKNLEDYTFFWVENSTVTFKAEKNNFKQALITGSKTEVDQKKLLALLQPIKSAKDSIVILVRNEKSEIRRATLGKELKVLDIKEKEVYPYFIKKNPNSIISAYVLCIYSFRLGKPVVECLYSSLSSEIKNSSFGKTVLEFIKLNKGLRVGNHYADFSQPNADGKMVKLSNYIGKYTLLEFWASWCPPCRVDNPELVKIYNQFKNKGFEIVGVSADSNKNDWLKAIQQDKLPWLQICDLKAESGNAVLIYGIYSFPSNFLIDNKGIIVAKDLRGEELKEKLTALLK